jgi:hypothetical protein
MVEIVWLPNFCNLIRINAKRMRKRNSDEHEGKNRRIIQQIDRHVVRKAKGQQHGLSNQ